MITNFKIFERADNNPVNPVSWHGKPFWIGIFDYLDGEIIATWNFETAENAGFHHNFYMDQEYLDKISNDEYGIFWFNSKNDCEIDNRDLKKHDNDLVKKIKSQLDN